MTQNSFNSPQNSSQFAIAQVRQHIEANLERAVTLDELGSIAQMSPFTLQKRFKLAMGVSPLDYQRALRAAKLREHLKAGKEISDAIYEAGFSSSSRVYEDAGLGMTPARFAKGGKGEKIGFHTAATSFGWIVVGATERGLCWLALTDSDSAAEASLRSEFPAATFARETSLALWVDAALAYLGEASSNVLEEATSTASSTHHNQLMNMPIDLRGTAFQLRVWNALRRIPRGETMSYSQLAASLGLPKATRAVARACATNRVAILVPCHRVVAASGSLTGYRWGIERKRALLLKESLRQDPAE